MTKTGKLTAGLLALFAITMIFSVCIKDADREKSVAVGVNAQAMDNVLEMIPEAVPVVENADAKNIETPSVAKIKAVAADAAMAKSAYEVKDVAQVRDLTESKSTESAAEFAAAAKTADAEQTTQAQENSTSAEESTSVAVEEETTVDNSNRLAGKWQATVVGVGLSVNLDYEFAQDGTLNVDFSENNYKTLTDRIERLNMSMMAEECAEEPEGNTDGIKLKDGLVQVPTYEEMKAQMSKTGTWELDGDTLTVTIDGESMTAETKLSEGATSFVLNPAGDAVSLIKY